MLRIIHAPNSTLKCNVAPFIKKQPKRVHMILSLRKTSQQVSRSPCHAHATPLPHGDQYESQGSSKPSDMLSSTSLFPHEKLHVLIDKVYTIFKTINQRAASQCIQHTCKNTTRSIHTYIVYSLLFLFTIHFTH